ncbi:MAG: hypothetical protein KF832_05500 [Caldilineaceae bacterium]|nr:hypothetical protein [Caldilineaceae bacterium]
MALYKQHTPYPVSGQPFPRPSRPRQRLSGLLITGLALWLLVACASPAQSPTVTPLASAPTSAPTPESPAVLPSPDPAAENIRQLLARQLRIEPAAITLVADEPTEWPDACLGVSLPNALCAQVVTPGHKLTFTIDGQTYVIHTDRDGYHSRVATAPPPAIGEMVLAWGGTFDNGECMEAMIGSEGVGFGLCGGQGQLGGQFVSPARQAVLAAWVAEYAPFDAETDFGSIRLVGTGTTMAAPAEQQLIGRWAQLVAMEAAAGESLAGLGYQGPADMGSTDTSKCALLQLTAGEEAGVGACDGTLNMVAVGERMAAEWAQIRDRFAPFVYATATERLDFTGMGGEASEPWQRALLAWTRARYAELASGQTSATINTAVSWHLGQDFDQKNVCRHLTVLDYGYAYAEERLCEGQDLVQSTGDWLTSAELAQLDPWLYERAPATLDQNYIDGKGSEAMSEAELAVVNEWALALWSRIRGTGTAVPASTDAPVCPEFQTGLAMVRDYQRGFCLLVPGDYTVFDIDPSAITIARDSLLNVTDPRLQIVARPAVGQSAEQVADALVAELAGFEITRSTTPFAGETAVVLDNVPGQDLNRRVLVVRNDRLYDLTFSPLDNPDLESFYTTILTHLVLIAPE